MTGEKIDWKELGYTKAIAKLGGANMLASIYPTRDTYSEQDELDFICGYNCAVADFANSDGDLGRSYLEEKDNG